MTLDVYYSATPNGWKISIMIEELKEVGVGLPEVRLHMMSLEDGDQFASEFTAINPNQRMPALMHDGRAIFESCAILQYLGETYPSPLLPQGPARWDVLPWLYWQAANLGPVFGNKVSYTRYIDVDEATKAHPMDRFGNEGARLVRVMARRLEVAPWLGGETFSVADIAAFPWVRAYKWAKIDITAEPRVVDWLERCRRRPGVQRGVAWGVPQEEAERFSADRRARYKAMGASIAANERLNERN
ncbi:glutathione S-transferase family protein [Minwuia thermotolerans]|nr:glutathione S-transferase N-terminal domain-containing protein [Minwuia thermotolerans]